MRVLVACEFSGIVRDAFKARGHDAWSCDLEPTENGGPHIQDDVLNHLDDGWDMMIAHPPCTDLAVSGVAWFKQKQADGRQQKAIELFMKFVQCSIPRKCIENPICIMSTVYRKPDQIIHPYYFGQEFSKPTCLWLFGLNPLLHFKEDELFSKKTHVGKGEFMVCANGKRGAKWNWGLPRTKDRAKIRSRTFQGIADAMADQWGRL